MWGSGFGNEPGEKAGGILQNMIGRLNFLEQTVCRNMDVEDIVGEALKGLIRRK